MKLRSDVSKVQTAPRKPIPYTHPVTEKITASNLSSLLLQLPQEIKNQIYTYVLGGKWIRVENKWTKNERRPYILYPCRIITKASSAQRALDAENDSEEDSEEDSEKNAEESTGTDGMKDDRIDDESENETKNGTDASKFVRKYYHSRCYHCMKPMHLPLDLLRTCRQIYHEANSVLYSANEFSFANPALLTEFIHRLDSLPSGSKTFALRQLHLHIIISNKAEEKAWNRALCGAAPRLNNLRSIDITIDEEVLSITNVGLRSRRKNRSTCKQGTFLTGLASLKKCRLLREMTLVFTGMSWYRMRHVSLTPIGSEYQKWAQGIRATILGGRKE